MDALTISGRVDESGRFLHGDKERLRDFLKSCAGQMVSFVVTPKGAKRTNAQNRLLWGALYPQVLERMLLAGGAEPDEARDEVVQEQAHYGLLMAHFGAVVDPVSRMQVPKKTSSQLNTVEFKEHVDYIIRKAAELGIVVEGIE